MEKFWRVALYCTWLWFVGYVIVYLVFEPFGSSGFRYMGAGDVFERYVFWPLGMPAFGIVAAYVYRRYVR